MRPTELPIYEVRDALRAAAGRESRLVVEAPTGSGKSTQIPQMLLDGGCVPEGQIVVLQPRRLAARLLAARVAAERGVPLGEEVGYQVRLRNCTGPRTRIRYVTEGLLLRQLLGDPALSGIHTLIFDEFHERHLEGDVALAQALRLQRGRRPDLRLLVMSATLDALPLERYLAPCSRLRAQGRTYPVAVEYLPRPPDERSEPVWDLAARACERLLRDEAEGDVLVFMPGAYEIGRTVQAIRALPAARGVDVLPLHGELPEREQDLAVGRSDRRKIVVATNVAETSLTIEGIRLVVDSGLARVPRFDPYRGIDTLLIETISRASADQRAGRAGRTAPGRCLRLWTEAEHRERPRQTAPEIQRVDLAETVLALKAGGTGGTAEPATGDPLADVRAFPWLDPPGDRQLERAGRLLTDLGAMDARTGALTPLGRQLAAFPAHPRFARMLLAAAARGCVRPAAFIAALTQERGLLVRRPDDVARELRELRLPDEAESDFFHLRHAWEYARDAGYDGAACRRIGIHPAAARRVEQNFEYFLRLAREEGLDTAEGESGREALQQCILAGFADQLARRADRHSLRCLLVHERRGTLSRESVVRGSPLLVAAEVRELETRGGVLEVVLSLCTAVRRDWLETLYPGDLRVVREVAFDPAAKRVVARENRYFRDLLLDSGPPGLPAADEAARLLADAMLRGTLALKHWNHALEQWIERVNLVAGRCPELGIPPIDEAATRHLLEQVCHGGFGLKDVRERPVLPVFRSWLAPEQQAQVERLAPERVALPNGRTPKVVYGRASPPHIALRIQELYGVEGRVTIAGGRVPLRIHVLAPNQRPVQITEDLAGFWRDHYPRVKQELRRKYPRHEWR